MGRRYRYGHNNPHDASPHYGMLNFLIGLAVLLCLWNVWTAPSPDTDTSYVRNNSQKYSYNSNDGRMRMNSGEEYEEQKQRSNQQDETSYSMPLSDGSSRVEDPHLKMSSSGKTTGSFVKNQQLRSIPTTLMDGHKVIVLSPSMTRGLRQDDDSHTMNGLKVQRQRQRQQQHQPRQSLQNVQIVPAPFPLASTTDNVPKTKALPSNRGLSEYSSSNDSHLSQPVQSRSRSSSSSSPKNIGNNSSADSTLSSSSYTRGNRRPLRWSHFIYAIAVSCSLLAGGVYAKRTLERIDRWEQLSKEDSLAFDIAYTTMTMDTYSDVSYGSFGSVSTTDWSGDYLDRFDI
ncbi:MAG: hypothetical protein ACI8RD_010807 [Bacillariaceae sp.]|jgi:hypothetical protein